MVGDPAGSASAIRSCGLSLVTLRTIVLGRPSVVFVGVDVGPGVLVVMVVAGTGVLIGAVGGFSASAPCPLGDQGPVPDEVRRSRARKNGAMPADAASGCPAAVAARRPRTITAACAAALPRIPGNARPRRRAVPAESARSPPPGSSAPMFADAVFSAAGPAANPGLDAPWLGWMPTILRPAPLAARLGSGDRGVAPSPRLLHLRSRDLRFTGERRCAQSCRGPFA